MFRNNYRALMLATFSCLLFAGSVQAQPTYFNREIFDDDFPTLLTERFENGNAPTGFDVCAGPIDDSGDFADGNGDTIFCFQANDILPGVSFDTVNPSGGDPMLTNLLLLGDAAFGNTTQVLYSNIGDASFITAFAGNSNNAVGLDVHCLFGTSATLDVFGASSVLLASLNLDCGQAGVFFGYDAGQNITGIALTGVANSGDFVGADNVSYSNVVRPPASPTFSCEGFAAPMANHPVKAKKNRALPLKMQLFDAGGFAVTDLDVAAAPLVQVLFVGDSGGDPEDVSSAALSAGHGTDGNKFEFTDDGLWQHNLKTNNYSGEGTYTISVLSGDDTEYTVDPTCESSFVVK